MVRQAAPQQKIEGLSVIKKWSLYKKTLEQKSMAEIHEGVWL